MILFLPHIPPTINNLQRNLNLQYLIIIIRLKLPATVLYHKIKQLLILYIDFMLRYRHVSFHQ